MTKNIVEVFLWFSSYPSSHSKRLQRAPGTATGSGQLVGLKGGQEDVFRPIMKYERNISTIKILGFTAMELKQS